MIHTDGKPTIAMRESEASFKEYKKVDDSINSYLVMFEVEGEFDKAQDFVSTVEKLEYPGLGFSRIFSLREFAERFN